MEDSAALSLTRLLFIIAGGGCEIYGGIDHSAPKVEERKMERF